MASSGLFSLAAAAAVAATAATTAAAAAGRSCASPAAEITRDGLSLEAFVFPRPRRSGDVLAGPPRRVRVRAIRRGLWSSEHAKCRLPPPPGGHVVTRSVRAPPRLLASPFFPLSLSRCLPRRVQAPVASLCSPISLSFSLAGFPRPLTSTFLPSVFRLLFLCVQFSFLLFLLSSLSKLMRMNYARSEEIIPSE